MTRDEFKQRLIELRSIILDGVAYFTVWRELMVEDDDSAKALNRHRAFFLPARNALFWMSLMQFAKVFDRDLRTVSFRNLLGAAVRDKANLLPHAEPQNLEDLNRKMASNEEVLERLKRLRDQRIAHHDAIAPGDRSVLYGEMRQLVEDVKSMYNALSLSHERSTTSFEHLSRECERHTSEVVGIMREEREKHMQRTREWRRRIEPLQTGPDES